MIFSISRGMLSMVSSKYTCESCGGGLREVKVVSYVHIHIYMCVRVCMKHA